MPATSRIALAGVITATALAAGCVKTSSPSLVATFPAAGLCYWHWAEFRSPAQSDPSGVDFNGWAQKTYRYPANSCRVDNPVHYWVGNGEMVLQAWLQRRSDGIGCDHWGMVSVPKNWNDAWGVGKAYRPGSNGKCKNEKHFTVVLKSSVYGSPVYTDTIYMDVDA